MVFVYFHDNVEFIVICLINIYIHRLNDFADAFELLITSGYTTDTDPLLSFHVPFR